MQAVFKMLQTSMGDSNASVDTKQSTRNYSIGSYTQKDPFVMVEVSTL
jgi:hypothetical protein